jgi:hypothetical protein
LGVKRPQANPFSSIKWGKFNEAEKATR